MGEELVSYLETQQRELGLTARCMADRLGVSETHWSKIRRTRRRLPIKVLERALLAFPDIATVVAAHAGSSEPERQQVPA